MRYDGHNSGSIWIFLAGSAVGAAAGLLLAPRSGRATRRKIRRSAEDGIDELSTVGRKITHMGKEIYHQCEGLADEATRLVDQKKRLFGRST